MAEQIKIKEEKMIKTARYLDVDLVLLFGSRADGTNRKDSDFDVAYRSKKLLSIEEEDAFYTFMMKYFGSENIHILNIKNAKPLTLYEIMRNCKVLYAENMMSFYELRSYIFKRNEYEVKPIFQTKFNRLKEEYLTK